MTDRYPWQENISPPVETNPLLSGQAFNQLSYKGPVVQSIVSLTKSLIKDSLSLLECIKSSAQTFFANKMRGAFALQKLFNLFGKKWQSFCVSYLWNFNVSLTLLVLNNQTQVSYSTWCISHHAFDEENLKECTVINMFS